MTKDELRPAPTTSFADLGVDDILIRALAEGGITSPFPIQEMALPIALSGADLIGQARTGTGKTLAFGLPLLQHVLLERDEDYEDLVAPGKPQALVLTPTRELASQVTAELTMANKYRGARLLTVYGGVGYDDQVDTLTDGVDIVVGTPGRLLDLADRRILDLSHVVHLVLDEADEMLDMGFLPDVERLVGMTDANRQAMLFSATMPGPIVSLARASMHQPVNVRAEGHEAQLTVPQTTQFVYQAHDLDKPEILGKLLQTPGLTKMMVFTRTKRSAQRISDELVDRGFNAVAIHGDLPQTARERSLRRFRKGDATVLVATDVAARGIDVAGVSHVVNYECPDDEKMYVHRIGRTGRAGNAGVAVTFVDWSDVTRWKVINKALDLPFTEITESYSTTPELLTDLGIPEGTAGRLIPARPREHHAEESDRRRSGSRGTAAKPESTRARRRPARAAEETTEETRRGSDERPPRHRRVRQRTRNGRPVTDAPETPPTND